MPSKKAAAAPDTADREFTITRVFDFPRERVFEAWADPKQIVKWWGPRGFSTDTDKREFKTGGTWQHTMIGPDGTKFPNAARYDEIVRPERIVYSNGGHKEGGVDAVSFRSTVTFEDLGNGKTRVTMHGVFKTAAMRETAVKTYGAIVGGHQTLTRLGEHLAGIAAPAFELWLERIVDAPRERVWAAWEDPRQVARWFAPRPYTLSVQTMDLRTGGKFAMTMHAPDGAAHAFGGDYVEVVAPSRIIWAGEFPEGPKRQIRTMVEFVAEGTKTRIVVNQAFATLTPATEPYTKGAKQGWTMTLDQLTEVVEG